MGLIDRGFADNIAVHWTAFMSVGAESTAHLWNKDPLIPLWIWIRAYLSSAHLVQPKKTLLECTPWEEPSLDERISLIGEGSQTEE